VKTKTERVEAAVHEVLLGGRDPSLNDSEQKLYELYAEEVRLGKFDVDGDLYRLDYVKKPPTIDQFILDDYYLGRSWRPIPGENEGIWPAWLELFKAHMDIESRIHNMVITGSLGIGKCHRRGDKVMLASTELKTVETVCVGDRLMGDDSTPRTVLSLAQGEDFIYEIRDNDGDSFFVNKHHILCLNFGCNQDVVEISVQQFLALPAALRNQARLYRVRIELPERLVRIDPYWLGLWLGDGTARRPHLTSADSELAAYHTRYAAQFGLEIREDVDQRGNAAKTYCAHTTGSRRQRRMEGNPLTNLLRSYHLCTPKNGYAKFIPDDFLKNSRVVRRALLAGLLDTDGSLCCAGVYDIASKYEHLASQIQWLARSLGYRATTAVKIVNATAYWRVTICGADDLPLLLSHKKSPPRRADDYFKQLKFAVIPRGKDDYFGFTLDGNGRYLLPNFVVTHNTVMMVTAMLYRICIACHLKNPQNFFGLNRNSNIVYNFLSVTKEAVKDTAFGNAMTYMGDSPYFMEVCRFNPDLEYSSYRIPMLSTLPDGRGSNIWISAGSKGQHVLGRNLCGIGLDEGNFRLEKDPDLKAYELYDQVRTRIANRFQKIASYLPALSVIASSAQDESSFTEKVVHEIEEANRQREKENESIKDEASKLPVTQMVVRNAVYKIKRHALTGIGPDHHWFRVAYGLKNTEPYILAGWYTEGGSPIETGELHEEPPSGSKTELVPKFYWEAYRRNCKAQLQNLSGISVGGAHRLFPSVIDIEQCLTYSEQDKVPNPMLPGVQRIPLSAEDNLNIWDSLNHKAFLTRVASRIQPIRHPNNLRYAHIDLATQTLAGLAICHLAGSQLVDGLVKDGQPFAEYRLVVEYDFILTICAGATKPINIEKIQRFFFWLRDMCGYRFGKVTADMWNSAAPLQSLEARSFDVDVLSVDRDKSVYHAWRTGFEEHCIRLHRNEQMLREAVELLEMDKKFDHPPDGSKDTTDAAAGAYFNAVNSDEKLMLISSNAPSIYTSQTVAHDPRTQAPMSIPLPEKGYNRSKVFEA